MDQRGGGGVRLAVIVLVGLKESWAALFFEHHHSLY